MPTAYIALGSNLGDRKTNLVDAIDAVSRTPGVTLRDISRLHQTTPVGMTDPDAPDFLNCVIRVETDVPPVALMQTLLAIETRLGRPPRPPHPPRPLSVPPPSPLSRPSPDTPPAPVAPTAPPTPAPTSPGATTPPSAPMPPRTSPASLRHSPGSRFPASPATGSDVGSDEPCDPASGPASDRPPAVAPEHPPGETPPARVERGYLSRTIDLDLLLYGDVVMATPELTLPHPRFHERPFVLQPLAEIAPDAVHPVLHLRIADLLSRPTSPHPG